MVDKLDIEIKARFTEDLTSSGTVLSDSVTTASVSHGLMTGYTATHLASDTAAVTEVWTDLLRTVTTGDIDVSGDVSTGVDDTFGDKITTEAAMKIQSVYIKAAAANLGGIEFKTHGTQGALFMGSATSAVAVYPGGVLFWSGNDGGPTITTILDQIDVTSLGSGVGADLYDIQIVFGPT